MTTKIKVGKNDLFFFFTGRWASTGKWALDAKHFDFTGDIGSLVKAGKPFIKQYKNEVEFGETNEYLVKKTEKMVAESTPIRLQKTSFIYECPGEVLRLFKAQNGKIFTIREDYAKMFEDYDFFCGDPAIEECPMHLSIMSGAEKIGILLPFKIEKIEEEIKSLIN